jgi:hypothetical protein
MESREIIELILKEIRKNSYINISEFLTTNNLKNLKIKDLIFEIETNYNNELILDFNNKEIYSYELVYNYFKLKLFESLEKNNDLDLSSDDFKEFKPQDIIRIFCRIDTEFFNYLLGYLNSMNNK